MAKVQQLQGQLMKNLYHYLSNIEEARTSLQEGQSIDFVLNEEYSIRTDIVAVDGRDVYVGLDRRAYELLERAGVMEAPIPAAKPNQINLAQSNQTMSGAARPNAPAAAPAATGAASLRAAQNRAASGTTGTATATPAAAAAAPAPSGARNPTAGAKPAPKSASTTNANVKAANAAFVANQAKAPQGDQTAGGKTNADFLPGAAGGTKPAAAPATTDSGSQPNAFGVMPQANIPGSPTGSSAAAPSTSAPASTFGGIQPQANIPGSPTGTSAAPSAPASTFGGIQPQANIPGSPTGTSAAAPATATSALPITTTGGPTAANPASVNPATQGGPAVTGGFGQETNISRDSDDVIAKRGPMGIQMKEQAPRELDRVLQLAGVKRG